MKVGLKDFYHSNAIISDYLNGQCEDLHGRAFSKENIMEQSLHKSFSDDKRIVLSNVLKEQYAGLTDANTSLQNIESLKSSNVFTVTTGHQLNVFTGPMFFIYKILQVINITEDLNNSQSEKKFVPVYWMASEDHDFEEISSVNVFNQSFNWEKEFGDAVGRMNLDGLSAVADEIQSLFRETDSEVFDMLKAYSSKDNLAEATRYLVHHLFGKYGLVILDADHKDLKQLMIPVFKDELLNSNTHLHIHDTLSQFDKNNYKIQVNPREINLFYLNEGHRGRIIQEKDVFKIANSSLEFVESEILDCLEKHPERFSPNVVIRPMYQETILPNVAYLGGAGEISYWLEFKKAFQENDIEFPILIVRNSILLIDKNTKKKMDKIGYPPNHYLGNEDQLIKEYLLESNEDVELKEELDDLNILKEKILKKGTDIHPSLASGVEAVFSKFGKELSRIEAKFLKQIKQNSDSETSAIRAIKSKFFPNGVFQERYENVIPYLVTFDLSFIDFLKSKIDSFEQNLEFVDLEEYERNS